MSRWSDELEKHQIHETLKQVFEWISSRPENPKSELEVERRRLLKLLNALQEILDGLDPELVPYNEITDLNNHMRQQDFWTQLSSYASNTDVDFLRVANDHMNSEIPLIYRLGSLSKPAKVQTTLKSIETAYDDFCKTIEETKANFDTEIKSGETKLRELEEQVSSLKAEQNELKTNTESAFNDWQTEFTETQTANAKQHSDATVHDAA